jgi:hypothetical protein
MCLQKQNPTQAVMDPSPLLDYEPVLSITNTELITTSAGHARNLKIVFPSCK